MRRLRTALVLVAATAAALAAAPVADASVTIGQLFTPTAQTTATLAQTTASNGASYTVPSDGVIVSWGFLSDSAGGRVRLKLLRANADGTYVVSGQSDYQDAAPGQQQSFPTRIPVKAGDLLGTAAASGKTVAYTGAPTDSVVLAAGDQDLGSSNNYSVVQGIRIDATATIEPDADRDGYGDETQDVCPSDPALQTRCQAGLRLRVTTSQRAANPGQEVTFGLLLHNDGPSASTGVQLVAELSPELKLLGTAGANCSGGPALICSVGDIPKNGDVVVTVVAQAWRTGAASVAARAGGATDDVNQADNAGGAAVAITWRSGRCANVFAGAASKDFLRGTSAGDRINGFDGNDVINGLSGDDCISGGAGNDSIQGGDGRDSLDGGDGADRLSGGRGADKVLGGAGGDRINVADSSRDTVDCGAGRNDAVRVDRRDRVRRCEHVTIVKSRSRRAK